MRRSQFLKVMGILLVPGMLVLLAPRVWADSGFLESSGVLEDIQPELERAPALSGGCTITKVRFVTREITSSTINLSYVNIAETSVSFTMGGTTPSCVTVEFAAMAWAPSNGNLEVRAILDGNLVGSPRDVQLSGDDDEDNDGRWARSHAMNFAFNDVRPGPHTITIQFRSATGSRVFVGKASTFVHHR